MTSKRPLLDISALTAFAGIPERRALEWIEDGTLYPAFNLGSKTATYRRLIRLPARLVLDCMEERSPQPMDLKAFLASMVPPGQNPPAAEVARLCSCSPEHVVKLLTERELAALPGSKPRRGRGGSPQITRESLLAWLEKRTL
jgi:hypothetical protein